MQPVLLRGRVDQIDGATGELLHRYTTVHEPGGVLSIACKTRRASRCPPCAETYRADTYQLIRAGLTGGKGIPATVAQHPCVFTTLTAPSFGPVHASRERDGKALACHPRRNAGACPHGVRMSCPQKHARDDDRLGEPLCADCYDYTGSVLFNACAPELWRRFTITLRRTLAHQSGFTGKAFTAQARLSYAKVAEYQRRGVVHLQAIIRLDGPTGPADQLTELPVVPPCAIKSRSVCGLPVVSLPAQGLVGLLWASARYGLAPLTTADVEPDARSFEAKVHNQLAPVVDRVRSGGFYRGLESSRKVSKCRAPVTRAARRSPICARTAPGR